MSLINFSWVSSCGSAAVQPVVEIIRWNGSKDLIPMNLLYAIATYAPRGGSTLFS